MLLSRDIFAGIIYTMAKAYLRWNDDRYLQSCIKAGEVVWERGLLKKGPGTKHDFIF